MHKQVELRGHKVVALVVCVERLTPPVTVVGPLSVTICVFIVVVVVVGCGVVVILQFFSSYPSSQSR